MQALAEHLNRECFCITLDRAALERSLDGEARPNLFAATPVFLPETQVTAMLRIVHAVERVAALPGYRDHVLAWGPWIARHDPGPLGVFMGYDFHVTPAGPKLIEINTNAGGAWLNAQLVRAQRPCCNEVDEVLRRSGAEAFEAGVLRMFESEWRRQRGSGRPEYVAIVDDRPQEQYLYPEFLLARRSFAAWGIEADIVDGADLRYERGRLVCRGRVVDLVYNRLVDFSLEEPRHTALRAAFLDNAAVVTPNPHVHALFADKRNLTLLSSTDALRSFGATHELLDALEAVPRAVQVTPENAAILWRKRSAYFFKPAGGHGSKAVYRGDKITRRVWNEIMRGDYVAQELAVPGERVIELDGVRQKRKADVRLYVYDGRMLLMAARLYQGQTTNFRTPGGGFAPLLAL